MIKRIVLNGKNSNAIIIPTPLVKKYNLHISDYVVLEEKTDGIFIRKLIMAGAN